MNISRRGLLGGVGLAGLAVMAGGLGVGRIGAEEATTQAGDGLTTWERRAAKKRELAKGIVWLTHEPLEFLLRRGDHFDDEAEHYKQMCDPENIKRMAAAGVKWGRIFFYKGFGLKYERPHIEQAKAVAEVMHQLGMKVSLYVGGTMFVETLYREVPEAEGWEQRDYLGQPVTYGSQTFRHYACPNEPAYQAYLKGVLDVAVTELHADELAFDNIMLQSEPKSCRCARCMKAFTEFLRGRYPTNAEAMGRFGLPDVEAVRITPWDSAEQPNEIAQIDDPVLQEWTRFRCQSLANYANTLYDHVKGLNADTAVLLNIKGVYSFNRYWTNAVYHPLFADHVDLIAFDTGGYNEHIDAATGALVSQVRSYKMARRVHSGCEDSFADDLRAATHMAFGYQKPVKGLAAAPFGSGAHNVFTPLMEFFREYNDRYYVGTEAVADVAVVRTWASMAYSVSATSVPATLMEQVLIQHHVLWDLLFDEELEGLERYGAVVLAGQECVSDGQVKVLMDYVRGGGSLVVTGNTGAYNERRERRHENPFLPAREEGKGRIVYVPEIVRADKVAKGKAESLDPEPGAGGTKTERMSPSQWVLPKNHEEVGKAVVGGVTAGVSLATGAPLTTLAEVVKRAATKETIVHFVNFDRKNSVEPFEAKVRKQFSGGVTSVLCFLPERDEPVALKFEEREDGVAFTVPAMELYAMVVL